MITDRHTPGPWTFSLDDHKRGRIHAGGQWIATTWTKTDNDVAVTYPAEANARLIAAAPELLETLRDTDAHFSAHFGKDVWAASEIAKTIRAAIAKAGGAD